MHEIVFILRRAQFINLSGKKNTKESRADVRAASRERENPFAIVIGLLYIFQNNVDGIPRESSDSSYIQISILHSVNR